MDWARDDGVLGVPFCRAERWEEPQGGLGCVANAGVISRRFGSVAMTGLSRGFFGSVATKGVRESWRGNKV